VPFQNATQFSQQQQQQQQQQEQQNKNSNKHRTLHCTTVNTGFTYVFSVHYTDA
jgi:hypothetical protein